MIYLQMKSLCSRLGRSNFTQTGATPVDFAFSIHSDMGNCAGAKVNGRLVLALWIENGDLVEIITMRNKSHPKTGCLLCAQACKIQIRSFVRYQNVCVQGSRREMLERALKKVGISLQELIKDDDCKYVEKTRYRTITTFHCSRLRKDYNEQI